MPHLNEPTAFQHMFSTDPSLRTQHYVIGDRSPFIYKGPSLRVSAQLIHGYSYDATSSIDAPSLIGALCTWAVYAGHHSINGSYMLQGGAISAIFDYATACIGTTLFNPGSFALTKSVTTKFLRGANPVPGVFKVVCEVVALDLHSGSMTLKSTLTNATVLEGERPFAVSECVMIDGPRRKVYKELDREKKRAITMSTTSDNGSGVDVGGTSSRVVVVQEQESSSSSSCPAEEMEESKL